MYTVPIMIHDLILPRLDSRPTNLSPKPNIDSSLAQEQEPEPSLDMEQGNHGDVGDMEDFGAPSAGKKKPNVAVATKRKRDDAAINSRIESNGALTESWEDVLGPPPDMGRKRVRHLKYYPFILC